MNLTGATLRPNWNPSEPASSDGRGLNMSKESSSTVVFAGSSPEAAIVRSFLESRGIAARLADEYIGTTAPHLAAGGGAGAVNVVVDARDAARAQELLVERDRRD